VSYEFGIWRQKQIDEMESGFLFLWSVDASSAVTNGAGNIHVSAAPACASIILNNFQPSSLWSPACENGPQTRVNLNSERGVEREQCHEKV
jgi:hypothetical protein